MAMMDPVDSSIEQVVIDMISEQDIKTIQALARKYGVKRVLLFGSCVLDCPEGHDIDLAVSGIPSSRFFPFYGELLCAVTRPVDLVDLDKDSLFTRLIRKEGFSLYEQAA